MHISKYRDRKVFRVAILRCPASRLRSAIDIYIDIDYNYIVMFAYRYAIYSRINSSINYVKSWICVNLYLINIIIRTYQTDIYKKF